MTRKIGKKIPVEKEKKLLRIYNLLKLHNKEVDAFVNGKDVRKLRTTLKNLDELIELKALTQGQEIKEKLLNDFFLSHDWYIYRDFGKVRHGRPQGNFPLDVLIYLLNQEHGDDYNSIDDFLNENIGLVLGEEAIRKRLERTKKDELIRHYHKFVSLARTVKVTGPASIAVVFHLPILK